MLKWSSAAAFVGLVSSGTTACSEDVRIRIPSALTRLTCYYGDHLEHWEDIRLQGKGEFDVIRQGQKPKVGYIITFALQKSPYYCGKVEWSTRSDLDTTGSAP